MLRIFFALMFFLLMSEAQASVNLRLNAAYMIFGAVGLEADFKLSDHWTLGPTALSWDLLKLGGKLRYLRQQAFGIRSNYFFKSAEVSSEFVSLRVAHTRLNMGTSDLAYGDLQGEEFGIVTSILGGGQKVFKNTITLSAAGGITSYSYGKVDLQDSSGVTRDQHGGLGAGTGLTLELNVGYIF